MRWMKEKPAETLLRDICECVPRPLHALDVLFLKKGIDCLLDVRDLRREALRDLGDHLLNQWLILHRLSCLHDTIAW